MTPSTIEQAENALQRLDELARRFELPAPAPVTAADARGAGADPDAVASFVARMDDDLDTPGALAGIFDLARRAHSAADAGDTETGQALARTAAILCGALGLALGGTAPEVDAAAAALVAERDATRAAGDYGRADAIRAELEGSGWVVEDGPDGTRLHRRPGA